MNADRYPCVCHQAGAEHVHYDVVQIQPPALWARNPPQSLLRIAQRLGTASLTAGQVIQQLLARQEADPAALRRMGIRAVLVQRLPADEICHKGEADSPTVDWNARIS